MATTILCVALGVTCVQAQLAPPPVEKLNNGNWPSEAEAQELLDELYYQRAIHEYMTILPALNVIRMRDGSEKAFCGYCNILPIWKDRIDSRCWVPTPNAGVIYSMSYLDLKKTDPPGATANGRRAERGCSNDALAICKAALRPEILAVPVKPQALQDLQMLHRIGGKYELDRFLVS